MIGWVARGGGGGGGGGRGEGGTEKRKSWGRKRRKRRWRWRRTTSSWIRRNGWICWESSLGDFPVQPGREGKYRDLGNWQERGKGFFHGWENGTFKLYITKTRDSTLNIDDTEFGFGLALLLAISQNDRQK